jgi:1-acyl-sn-glycerol-3-phosphate acyltransferase
VPIVPTAISGSAQVRNWRRLRFPKVTVQYGDPIRFEQVESPTREQAQAAADVIFESVKELYYGLQHGGRRGAVQAARRARRAAAQAAAAAARRPAAS